MFPPDRLCVERFRPAPKGFAPDEDALLDALNHAGPRGPSGRREGVCGGCEIVLLDGEPEHLDGIGAPPGGSYACVSRGAVGHTHPRPATDGPVPHWRA
ncbi:2Fe-2S iron-sulfur cluster binding domain-containing protein [Streptomyces sp. NPDC046859]|uniref:2Fe-2S iron-sulfur cluster-binding protein n=1 Tax=Streptomyces sp. NPDC046859 TaxID=3155734 RepID=UPI0033F4A22B